MKFFTIATSILPMAAALSVEKRSHGIPKVHATIDGDDLNCLDRDAQSSDALSMLRYLLDEGKIDIIGADDKDLSKRRDVPFLNCGYARATRCGLSSSGVLTTCMWAAINYGQDVKEDTKCIGAATAFGANLPNDCKLCLGV